MAVVHWVEDPMAAKRILVEQLSFVEVEDSADLVVTNGALTLRLRQPPPGRSGGRLCLDLVTEDLASTVEFLQESGLVNALGVRQWDGEHRLEQLLELFHGIDLMVVKELDEDDLGRLPELPATLPWDPDGDLLIREILRSVPLAFRHAARKRITRQAEKLARQEARQEVAVEDGVRALFQATPAFQHAKLREELERRGVANPGEGDAPNSVATPPADRLTGVGSH